METANVLSSSCSSADEVRDLVVRIERLGVDTSRIDVVADPAVSTVETSMVDQESVRRPGRRVATGIAAGLAAGFVAALVVVTLFDAIVAPTLIAFAIGGTLLGALAGLYWRLAMNTELADVDTGQAALLRVNVENLDGDTVAAIGDLLDRR